MLTVSELQAKGVAELKVMLDGLSRNRSGSFLQEVREFAFKSRPRDVPKEYRYAVLIQRVMNIKMKATAEGVCRVEGVLRMEVSGDDPSAEGVTFKPDGSLDGFRV